MHSLEMMVEVRVLARQGKSIKEIGRETGLLRNTVRKYLRTEAPPIYGPRTPRPAKLDPYKGYLRERVETAKPHWIPATVVHLALFAQDAIERGFTGHVAALIQSIRDDVGRGSACGIRDGCTRRLSPLALDRCMPSVSPPGADPP